MTRPRLHGTDGIRGRIEPFDGDDEAALNALVKQRVLSNRSMRIIGEATGLFLMENVGESPLVILGWDRRDGNATLVDSLESGLGAAGCRTLRVGELPTPGLHNAVLASAADAGMMVTASHNPASDSGVKFFDSEGYKSMPDVEQRDRLMNNNQSLNEELNENGAKNNFSWSETSGVKIIRSLSDLNQALGKFILI